MYLGLQVKWNQLSPNNSHHTSCIHKGLHAEKWPDLMTSKPVSVSTLGYHWTDHTGRPLEPEVHWDGTGTTRADASTQWCSSGDPVLICIIGTHWNTTGSTLETHWLPTIHSPVAFQCKLGSNFQAHWIATGSPQDYHWLRVRGQGEFQFEKRLKCANSRWMSLNTVRPRQYCQHVTDDIFKCSFWKKMH